MQENRINISLNRDTPPCKDCTNRHTACHDTCPEYSRWKAEIQRIHEAEKIYRAKPKIKIR